MCKCLKGIKIIAVIIIIISLIKSIKQSAKSYGMICGCVKAFKCCNKLTKD